MFRKGINNSEPAGHYKLGCLSYDLFPFYRTLFTIIMLLLVSSCGKTPMTSSGTISLGGVPQKVASCNMSGSGTELALSLLLQGGATVTLPIHESKVLLQIDNNSSAVKLNCEKHAKDGTGSNDFYEGDISLSCGAAQTALKMELHIKCGEEPVFSNTDPDEKGPPR